MHMYLRAFIEHEASAHEAYKQFVVLCDGNQPPRVPGMDTVIRLAWRIECGRTVEVAAAHEYRYRWLLALDAPIFGAPHLLGM